MGKAKKIARPGIVSKATGKRIVRQPINSWSEFISIIRGWHGFRNWCFRGQRKARWSLIPTLSRHIEVSKVNESVWDWQESRIQRIFRRKSHLFLTDMPKEDDKLEWLALMQHYGAPTRLLDFTWSPYVAAFFALEHATEDAAIWAINLPLLWDIHDRQTVNGVNVGAASPRETPSFEKYYLPNKYAFVWQGDPFRMPQRVVAQSGTFLVLSRLGSSVEDILDSYPGTGELLIQFVLRTSKVRAEAMADLYSMNITQATLFPGLDGMARSMAYEFEYSWEFDLATGRWLESLNDPHLPVMALRK